MINNISSPDTKRLRTDAGGVVGSGGDVRKEGRVQIKLPRQEYHNYLHHHKQQQQTEGEDMRALPSPNFPPGIGMRVRARES